MTRQRVLVDVELCQSHGVCENEAPDYFEVPKRGPVRVLREFAPDGEPALLAAVRYCPTHAISLEPLPVAAAAADDAGLRDGARDGLREPAPTAPDTLQSEGVDDELSAS